MDQNETIRTAETTSYTAIAKEVGATAKNILEDEIALLKAEVKEVGPKAAEHSLEMIAFGVLAALSVFPLLAFFVIGLGEIFNGNYWLSSLIVAVLCAGIGGPLAYRSFKRLKRLDLSFSRSRRGLKHGVHAVKKTAQAVQQATEGNSNEPTYQH